MPDEPTSMQEQSPLSEAQDSVHKASRAVKQALSNTTDMALQQAQNAIDKAQNAVNQLGNMDDKPTNEIRTEFSSVQIDYYKASRNRNQS